MAEPASPTVAGGPLDVVVHPRTGRDRPRLATILGRFCRKKPLGAVGGLLMLIMAVTALLADVLQTHDPIATDAAQTLAAPSRAHWLGSDHLGRDIYSRIV